MCAQGSAELWARSGGPHNDDNYARKTDYRGGGLESKSRHDRETSRVGRVEFKRQGSEQGCHAAGSSAAAWIIQVGSLEPVVCVCFNRKNRAINLGRHMGATWVHVQPFCSMASRRRSSGLGGGVGRTGKCRSEHRA